MLGLMAIVLEGFGQATTLTKRVVLQLVTITDNMGRRSVQLIVENPHKDGNRINLFLFMLIIFGLNKGVGFKIGPP